MSSRSLSRCLLVFLTGVLGCVQESGQGSLEGWIRVEACGEDKALIAECEERELAESCDAFSLGPTFFALEIFDEQSAKIRIQQGGASIEQVDGLVIDIADIRNLRGRLGQVLTVGADSDVRAGLILGHSCPDTTQSLSLSGQLIFRRFGNRPGDRISGEILFLEIRDGRAPLDGLIGVISGGFDFIYQLGQPFEQFYR